MKQENQLWNITCLFPSKRFRMTTIRGKKDPDSYYTDIDIFRNTEEVDYVLWMADKLFPLCENTEQKGDVIKQLAYLLSLIDDETKSVFVYQFSY